MKHISVTSSSKYILLFASLLLSVAMQANRHTDSLCIMSYNIHNAVGMDGKSDYIRISDVITSCAPDIVALQELDSMTHRSHQVYLLEQIAQRTGMHFTFGPAISYDGGKYGIGVLSKEQPLTVRHVPLPGREESRTLLIVEFEKYVFFATHLSLTPADEESSAEIIAREASTFHKPVFLAGDMNSIPSSKAQILLRRHFTTLTDTLWTTCEGTCIDYIYARENKHLKISVTDRQLIHNDTASDHRPVLVRLRFHHK